MQGEETGNRTVQGAKGGPGVGPAAAEWWMICRPVTGDVEAMTLPCCSGKALALFGHEEEAELFLRSLGAEGLRGGWRVREGRRGEVVSVLCGPCAHVQRVVLDPPPAMADDWTVALASVRRGDFLARLLAIDHAGQGAGRWARENAEGQQRSLRAAPLARRTRRTGEPLTLLAGAAIEDDYFFLPFDLFPLAQSALLWRS